MISPSGKVMLSGVVATRLLCILAWGSKKWAVAPESAIAWEGCSTMLIAWVVISSSDEKVDMDDEEHVEAVAALEEVLQLLVTTVLSSSSSRRGAGYLEGVI